MITIIRQSQMILIDIFEVNWEKGNSDQTGMGLFSNWDGAGRDREQVRLPAPSKEKNADPSIPTIPKWVGSHMIIMLSC